jgi:nitrite reductase/ring-hydroxylating ferredoxin subunit
MAAQRFIRKRGIFRWLGHMLLGWGCMIAFAVTFPLTFGWIHFTLADGSIDTYVAHAFGFSIFSFPLHSFVAENIFHVLNWCSVMVIVGVGIVMRRRLTDAGQIALQTFEGDLLPLLLLAAIAVTGLGLTWDYEFLQGRAHQFMAITHAITVILFLLWMPFGKFFHIFQRPAQLGVAIYRKEGEVGPQAICPHTHEAYASKLHVDDLKIVTRELGYNFTLADGSSHLDLSPQGKRAALAKAHLAARKQSGAYFG